MKIKKVVIGGAVALVAVIGALWVIGFMIPQRHRASVTVQLDAPPTEVWQLVRNMEAGAEWRDGVSEVRALSERAVETYAETSKFGVLHYEVEVDQPPTRLVTRIVDNKDFGGTWTYELLPADNSNGTRLTITEDGEIYSPMFRFFARFVFGYSSTLEAYASDLSDKIAAR